MGRGVVLPALHGVTGSEVMEMRQKGHANLPRLRVSTDVPIRGFPLFHPNLHEAHVWHGAVPAGRSIASLALSARNGES
jgi:hypothetical protein